ncbi:MAG: hypothetical protein Q8K92_07465 [Leadbetterella sp.]|nr:hypothetical protein [Leadbetterella sp.]
MRLILKRKIAKEVILFVSTSALIIFIGLFLFARNYYYSQYSLRKKTELNSLQKELDAIPDDKVKSLYEGLEGEFVKHYNLKGYSYSVKKSEDSTFINQYPNAQQISLKEKKECFHYATSQKDIIDLVSHMDNHNDWKGKFNYNLLLIKLRDKNEAKKLLQIFEADNIYRGIFRDVSDLMNMANNNRKDSTINFDLVDLNKFRKLVKEETYKYQLYNRFSEEFDLGSFIMYNEKIQSGENFDKLYLLKKEKIQNEIITLKNEITRSNNNILSKAIFSNYLFWISTLILICFYPLRFLIYAVIWSISIIRNKEN